MHPFLKQEKLNHNIILIFLLALVPNIIYGCYKNGILLYSKHFISFLGIIKPLLIPLIGLVVFTLVDIIGNKIIKKESWQLKLSLFSISGAILGMVMPPKMTVIFFFITSLILAIVLKLLNKYYPVNNIALSKLLLIAILILGFKINYLNDYEASGKLALSTIDIFFGLGAGGIAMTSCLGSLIGFAILCFNPYYKKDIPIFCLLSYGFCILIAIIFKSGYILEATKMMSGSVIFASIFIAPEMISSPASNIGKVFYGILLGIFSYLFLRIFKWQEGVYIAILFLSIFSIAFDKISYKLKLKKLKKA